MSTATQPASTRRSLPLPAALVTGSLEAAISAYLAVHPERSEALRPLAGKVLALRLRPFDWQLFLCPTDRSVQVRNECSGRPDATLSADISGYLRLGLGGAARASLAPGEIAVEGDRAFLEALRNLFAGLDRDRLPVRAESRTDGIDHPWLSLLANGLDWLRETGATLQADLAEYWQEEARVLPSRAEFEGFAAAVQHLQAEIEGLRGRVDRLTASTPAAD